MKADLLKPRSDVLYWRGTTGESACHCCGPLILTMLLSTMSVCAIPSSTRIAQWGVSRLQVNHADSPASERCASPTPGAFEVWVGEAINSLGLRPLEWSEALVAC
uniref:Uncharacterized protein n=1 Tax=Eutreptiella gymnastica TaxID=73025 RepID=A0A7S4GFG2_9EUGL